MPSIASYSHLVAHSFLVFQASSTNSIISSLLVVERSRDDALQCNVPRRSFRQVPRLLENLKNEKILEISLTFGQLLGSF